MTPKMRQGIIVAAFALLGIFAVAGWTRNTAVPAANAVTPSLYGQQTAYAPAASQPAYAQDSYGQPAYAQSAYMQTGDRVENCSEPRMAYTNAAYAPADSSARYRTYSRPRVVRSTYVSRDRVVDDRTYVVNKRGRSTKKSVAIVAGSAGAGAAIGALAGGGKGAGIGALSGGVAGFVYDRLTHNR